MKFIVEVQKKLKKNLVFYYFLNDVLIIIKIILKKIKLYITYFFLVK